MGEYSQNYSLPFNEHNNPPMRKPDIDKIKEQHAEFIGDPAHLKSFIKLAATPIRSVERSEALRQWKKDNHIPGTDERGMQIKGGATFRGFDLRGADLHNLCLGYIDLRGARLDQANMAGVRMKGAWLDSASMVGTNLVNSYFSYASFYGVDFSDANLKDANLTECKLIDANFSRATLTGAFLCDTQRRDWKLKDITCECLYWNHGALPIAYSSGEFEDLYSEDRVVQFSIDGKVDSVTVSSVPEIIRAFKQYHHTELNLLGVENINGVNRFRFTVNKESSQSISQIESKLDSIMKDLQHMNSQPRAETSYNFNTVISGQVENIFQAGLIAGNSKLDSSHEGNNRMANFNNKFENSNIRQLNQADTINNLVHNDFPLAQSKAQELMNVVETNSPEKDGFSEDMKNEVKAALVAVIKEGASSLAGKAYDLIKEFFPSYVKNILP